MSWLDSVEGLVQEYTGQNTDHPEAEKHFDQAASTAPKEDIANALSGAMRSGQTEPFPALAAKLFNNSSSDQKASLLNQLMAAAGPAIPSILGGSLGGSLGSSGLGSLLQQFTGGTKVTPQAADQISPDAVQQLAEHAHGQDPTIIDRVSSLYAEHPALIKTLGGAVLVATMSKLFNR